MLLCIERKGSQEPGSDHVATQSTLRKRHTDSKSVLGLPIMKIVGGDTEETIKTGEMARKKFYTIKKTKPVRKRA